VKALRERDLELDRQLIELEHFGKEAPPEKKAEPAKPKEKVTLDAPAIEPLLQATASRALDTCLRGGRGLAVLGDPQAFGLLLQLSREEDA
jgi:ParB family chromosome partitioning protein